MRANFVAAIFAVFLISLTTLVIADESYKDGSIKCSADEEKTVTLSEVKGGESIKSANDRCVHESITLDIKAGTLRIVPTGSTRKTGPDACKPNSCSEDTCGNVTFTPEDGKSCTYSKCDEDYKEKISQCIGGDHTALKDFEIRELAKDAITINTSDEQLQEVLKEFGATEAEAEAAVGNNKAGVIDLLRKAALGDTEGAQTAAKELDLNPDLFSNVARLEPEERLTKFAPALSDADKYNAKQIVPSWTGFGESENTSGSLADRSETQTLPTQCGIPELAGLIMRAESSCGRINYNPLSSVQGPYHFLCETWQSYARATGYGQYADCRYRNDVNISTQVMNKRLEQFAQQYGNTCTQYGLSVVSCQYAIHVFGEGGFRNMLAANAANPNASAFSLCGRALSSSACRNNLSIFSKGGTVRGVFGELERRLTGNSLISSVPTSGPSPFANITGSGQSPFNLGASPFSRSLPTLESFGGDSNTSNDTSAVSGSQTGSQTGGVTRGQFSGQSFQPSETQSQTQRSTSAVRRLRKGLESPERRGTTISPEPTPMEAAATLIAQPLELTRGQTLLVSWSSVGMSPTIPCRVLVQSDTVTSLVGEENEGSINIETSAITTPGVWDFTLRCTSLQNGELIDREASVTIH